MQSLLLPFSIVNQIRLRIILRFAAQGHRLFGWAMIGRSKYLNPCCSSGLRRTELNAGSRKIPRRLGKMPTPMAGCEGRATTRISGLEMRRSHQHLGGGTTALPGCGKSRDAALCQALHVWRLMSGDSRSRSVRARRCQPRDNLSALVAAPRDSLPDSQPIEREVQPRASLSRGTKVPRLITRLASPAGLPALA